MRSCRHSIQVREEDSGGRGGRGEQVALVGEAHLHRVDPGLGAAHALNRGDGGTVQLA